MGESTITNAHSGLSCERFCYILIKPMVLLGQY